jgi:hypothetical protein
VPGQDSFLLSHRGQLPPSSTHISLLFRSSPENLKAVSALTGKQLCMSTSRKPPQHEPAQVSRYGGTKIDRSAGGATHRATSLRRVLVDDWSAFSLTGAEGTEPVLFFAARVSRLGPARQQGTRVINTVLPASRV